MAESDLSPDLMEVSKSSIPVCRCGVDNYDTYYCWHFKSFLFKRISSSGSEGVECLAEIPPSGETVILFGSIDYFILASI